jgi:hypothetical protein
VPSSSGSSKSRSSWTDPDDEGAMILQNVGKHSPNDTVPHPRSLGSFATLLWVPHISHVIVLFVNEIECTDTTFEDSFGTLLAVCV